MDTPDTTVSAVSRCEGFRRARHQAVRRPERAWAPSLLAKRAGLRTFTLDEVVNSMICIVVGHEILDAVFSGESHYGSFVMKIVQEQLAAGTAASAAEVPRMCQHVKRTCWNGSL